MVRLDGVQSLVSAGAAALGGGDEFRLPEGSSAAAEAAPEAGAVDPAPLVASAGGVKGISGKGKELVRADILSSYLGVGRSTIFGTGPDTAENARMAAEVIYGRFQRNGGGGFGDNAWLLAQFDDPRLAASAREKIARTMPNSPPPNDPEVKHAVDAARHLIRYEVMRLMAEGR